jgi:hypothetical protein
MLICSYLLLQLVIAIVLDNIQQQYDQEELVIQQDHMWAFVGEWVSKRGSEGGREGDVLRACAWNHRSSVVG